MDYTAPASEPASHPEFQASSILVVRDPLVLPKYCQAEREHTPRRASRALIRAWVPPA